MSVTRVSCSTKALGTLVERSASQQFSNSQAARLETQKRAHHTQVNSRIAHPQTYSRNGTGFYATEEIDLPLKHTTVTRTILSWPSIRTLLHQHHNEVYFKDLIEYEQGNIPTSRNQATTDTVSETALRGNTTSPKNVALDLVVVIIDTSYRNFRDQYLHSYILIRVDFKSAHRRSVLSSSRHG